MTLFVEIFIRKYHNDEDDDNDNV